MAWFKKKAPPQTQFQDSVFGAAPTSGRVVRHGTPRRWSIAGVLIGLLAALVVFAPASWLARALASATSDHLLITDTRGSIWSGSGVVVLTGGTGSRDAAALPGRLQWRMSVKGLGLQLAAQQDCCTNGPLLINIQPGLGRMAVSLDNRADWLARLPAGVLAGLGTPWNTLQLGGSLRLSARDLKLESAQGRWRQTGELHLDLMQLSSRVSTVAPLGSYRFSVQADPGNAGVSTLRLSTLEGALQLSGAGTLSPGGKSRFVGEATAAPGREDALNNLLNIIGRRQGARSVLTIG
ncbi:type II secretion system protein N [Roseateles asaccharophilus]|uniref:Type II secretion system protein N n=1 Tax=Roseateles asaccharophilus TaxID=582607 RepID=A0ABU2A1G9_9BURK|nr:type II secretion system protein N [Roseateles asaccharophilus]MDR7331036.1 general secretion pathway protein N [Roseateles asaccharophilus]